MSGIREEVLVVVHPGSALGSANSNLGKFDAEAGRDALQWAFDHWEGPVLVIHGDLSDELPYYPEFQSSLKNMLARAKTAGHRSEEVQGSDMDDHNQEEAISQWVSEQNLTPKNATFQLTGAWYNNEGGGCVGSVATRLREMGYTAVVDEDSVLGEPNLDDDNDEFENDGDSPTPNPDTWPANLDEVLDRGKAAGFSGFGGECFAGALVLAEQLFPGQPVNFVGAFNKALHDQGISIGHVAIQLWGQRGAVYLDADGKPKEWDTIESWGMLETDDPDYAAMASEAGIAWNDQASNTTIRVDLTTAALKALCQPGDIARARRQLSPARPAVTKRARARRH